jgi:hypothetical protein
MRVNHVYVYATHSPLLVRVFIVYVCVCMFVCAAGAAAQGPVWKHAVASRKQPYVELLLAYEREKRHGGGGGGGGGAANVHTAGFQTVYRAMAGDDVSARLTWKCSTFGTVWCQNSQPGQYFGGGQINWFGQLFGTRQIDRETLLLVGVSYFGQRQNNRPNN